MKTTDLPRRPLSAAVLDRTWSVPTYWDGAAYTRDQLGDGSGARAARNIKAALTNGTPLRQIPDFLAWERARSAVAARQ